MTYQLKSVRYLRLRNIRQGLAGKDGSSLRVPNTVFSGLPGVVIEINHVLYGLVAMCVLPHVNDLHFAHFVYQALPGISVCAEYGRRSKYRVEHSNKVLVTSHQVN